MSKLYNADVTRVYRPLSKKEQAELYHEMKAGSITARETIIYSCLPLVYKLSMKFRKGNNQIDLEDMIQHGNIELIKAVDGWDIEKGAITTIVTRYIYNGLTDMVNTNGYQVKTFADIKKGAGSDLRKIKGVIGETSNPEEIAKRVGISILRVKKLLPIVKAGRIRWDDIGQISMNSSAGEMRGDSISSGCLADIFQLLEDVEEYDKDIFITWMAFIKKNDKFKRTAEQVGISIEAVKESVNRTKKTLKEMTKNEVLCD